MPKRWIVKSPSHRLLAALAVLGCMVSAQAMDEVTLKARLQARFDNDRTGACVVAAVVDTGRVTRARLCARPGKTPPDFESAFEIGSITKTMTAFLVADRIASRQWSMDDPIAMHLPAEAAFPRQGDRQILVRDLLSHSSGLPAMPSRLGAADNANPYAKLTEANLLASLADVQLSRPIGSRSEYSNFAMMLVSLALARANGNDFEGALKARLFVPLGMKTAFIERPPAGVVRVQGHWPSGRATPAWDIHPSLAGVGMVKASLDDMVGYAHGQLDATDPELVTRLRMTQQPVAHGWAMNWALARAKGRPVLMHEGGTGGFSSWIGLDVPARRAVVLLADTALVNLGGLADLGLSLLGVDVQVRAPRVTRPAPAELRRALLGDYEVGGTPVRIYEEGARLMWHDAEQGTLELLFDSAGEFYPADGEASLRPVMGASGTVEKFLWLQGGGRLEGSRTRSPPPSCHGGPEATQMSP